MIEELQKLLKAAGEELEAKYLDIEENDHFFKEAVRRGLIERTKQFSDDELPQDEAFNDMIQKMLLKGKKWNEE
jgi:hypothetical protein